MVKDRLYESFMGMDRSRLLTRKSGPAPMPRRRLRALIPTIIPDSAARSGTSYSRTCRWRYPSRTNRVPGRYSTGTGTAATLKHKRSAGTRARQVHFNMEKPSSTVRRRSSHSRPWRTPICASGRMSLTTGISDRRARSTRLFERDIRRNGLATDPKIGSLGPESITRCSCGPC